ncbi:phage tail tape measure protein [Gemmobacter denitrificans]|uniref:Phage tail tape measure protein n=1 Tax=Gemmobacter denitrificans TaxID=3123040 RepID=A0ABU8BQY2_9RHOB
MADANLERITILLQARDRDFARAMDRNNKLIAKFTRDAEQGTTRMSKKVQQNLNAMSSSFKGFATGFAGGIAGGLITSALGALNTDLRGTVASIAQVGDEAKRSGLGAQAFQEWAYVAKQNRVSIDALVDGFKELNLRADEWISTGAGPAAEAFKRIGFSPDELKARLKDPSSLMLEIIGRLQQLDKAAQIRVADEVFGGTGGEQFVQLIGQGREGLQGLIDRGYEVGAVMDEQMIVKAQELDAKFSDVETRLSSLWKTGVVGAAEFFGFIEAERERLQFNPDETAKAFGRGTAEALSGLGEIDQSALEIIEDTAAEIEGLSAAATNLLPALNDAAVMLRGMGDEAGSQQLTDLALRMADAVAEFEAGTITGEEYAAQLAEIGAEAEASFAAMSDLDRASLAGVIGQVSALLSWVGRLPGAIAAARNELSSIAMMDTGTPLTLSDGPLLPQEPSLAPTDAVRPKARPFELGVPDLPRRSGGGGGGRGGGGGSRDRFGDSLKDWRVEAEGILAEAEALNSLALSFDEYGISVDVARRKAELLQEAKEAGKEITPALRAEIDALAASYANASVELERAKERHDEFKSAVEQAKGTLSSAFVGLVTGANSFRDALGNVLGKLAEMMAMKAFESLWSGGLGSATGGLLGFLGFASGGYTGPGARNQPAGIVHKGEVVFSQDDVARAGGVAAVEAMRRNGVSRAMAPASASSAMAAQPITVTAYTDEGVILNIAGAAAVQQINRAAPGIVRQSVQATGSAMSRSKSFGARR